MIRSAFRDGNSASVSFYRLARYEFNVREVSLANPIVTAEGELSFG